jgi:hypothetical protein
MSIIFLIFVFEIVTVSQLHPKSTAEDSSADFLTEKAILSPKGELKNGHKGKNGNEEPAVI